MWRIVSSFIPDEWVSAIRAFKQMLRLAKSTRRSIPKHVIGLAVPFALGLAGYRYGGMSLSPDFIQAFLTVVGVLFGFVVTLMLFTGNTEGTAILDHIQAGRYGEKILYLLFSQTVTLACYLFALVAASLWLLSNKSGPHAVAHQYFAPFVFGGAALSLLRTALLPAQIYERHHYVIGAMIEQKQREHQHAIEQAREALAVIRE
jgi:heme exporter protein D